MNGILVIAHEPLATALRDCVLHVLPDAEDCVQALNVSATESPEYTLQQARCLLQQMPADQVLVLSDIFGATPCNVASKLVDGVHARLVTGVNLPMLLRSVTYRHEPLDALVTRAIAGGTQGVVSVNVNIQQNQNRRATHDQNHRDHQQ